VSKRGLIDSAAGPARLKRGGGTGLAIAALLLVWLLVSVRVHPLPRETSDRGAILLLGADTPESVRNVLAQACGNCHSQNTRWPWYSHVAPFSWLIESDVKRAREHLNLSRWNALDAVEQRSLLTAIATVVENREMPLHKYLMFHGEARLSPEDALQVIEWTLAERTRLRTSAASLRQ
jgi:Haem-binding domain